MELKTCTTCKLKLPKSDFYIRRASPDGLSYICKKCTKEKHKAGYEGSKEQAKERARKWALANPERRREIAYASEVRRREAYAERERELRLKRWQENLEESRKKVRDAQAKRRAAGKLDKKWWASVVNSMTVGGRPVCLYCGLECSKHHMDHFVSIENGGRTVPGNLAPVCQSCNGKKGRLSPQDYFGPDYETVLSRVRMLPLLAID